MNFEDQLRDRLRSSARDVTVAGRGVDHVVSRARERRRHRRAAVGTLAGVAILAGSVGYVSRRQAGPLGEVAVGTGVGLPSTGPLELSWTVDEGGVTNGVATSVAPDGTIYALSTAPGARSETLLPVDTLYAMGADGGWTSTGVGSATDLADVAAGSSLLYGIGTAPSTKGYGYVPVVATSSDGGGSWSRDELPAAPAPSTAVEWRPTPSVQVAATGDTAVAVVSTTFTVRVADLPGVDLDENSSFGMTYTDAGIEISRRPVRADGSPATVDPTGPGAEPAKSLAGPDGSGEEVVHVVPWSVLGLSGPEDLHRTDVYVADGDGWSPTQSGLGPLDYVAGLTVIGDEFVLSASQAVESDPSASSMAVLASTDGEQWRPVSAPSDDGTVVGLGSTWVTIAQGGRALQASTDRGATWRTVALPEGVPGNGYLYGLTSGPLGLALWVQDDAGPGAVVVTRDLENWDVLELAEYAVQPYAGPPSIIVGTDRVVVTLMISGDGAPGGPGRSRTIVGTPVRTTETSVSPATTGTSAPTSVPITSSTTIEPVVTTATTAVVPTSTTTSTVPTGTP